MVGKRVDGTSEGARNGDGDPDPLLMGALLYTNYRKPVRGFISYFVPRINGRFVGVLTDYCGLI